MSHTSTPIPYWHDLLLASQLLQIRKALMLHIPTVYDEVFF